ncbi:MAG: metallophosphoesterase, partial [Hyphomicrobiales bacterium]
LIHHLPLPGLAPQRRALEDAAALEDVLEAEGAELVLHGHNHRLSHETLVSRHGPVIIMGLPSASTPLKHSDDAAAWCLYRIERDKGVWRTTAITKSWDETTSGFVEHSRLEF